MSKKNLMMMQALIYASILDPKFSMPEPETKEDREEREKLVQKKINEKNGLKRWVIDGVEVWARDEKNAIRKAKNKLKS